MAPYIYRHPIIIPAANVLKSPLQFGANFWLDFADTSTMTRTGSSVDSITDKVGGKVFSAVGTPPTYDATLDDNRGGVTFASSRFFQASESGSYWNFWYTLNTIYLFMRVQYTAASGDFLYNINGSSAAGFSARLSPDGFSQWRSNFSDRINYAPNPVFSGFRSVRVEVSPTNSVAANRYIVTLDNTETISGNTIANNPGGALTVVSAPRIGNFGGHCREFFSLPSTASAQDLADAYAWLSR